MSQTWVAWYLLRHLGPGFTYFTTASDFNDHSFVSSFQESTLALAHPATYEH
jgi:hypothetical protein